MPAVPAQRSEAYREGAASPRLAHLAIAFCRAMNIPARYCTCYLGDVRYASRHIRRAISPRPSRRISEARLQMFDPRNNVPRIGRVLIARGRDAADVAIATTFGPNTLTGFKVWTDEVVEGAA